MTPYDTSNLNILNALCSTADVCADHVTGKEVIVSPVQHNEETNIKEKTKDYIYH